MPGHTLNARLATLALLTAAVSATVWRREPSGPNARQGSRWLLLGTVTLAAGLFGQTLTVAYVATGFSALFALCIAAPPRAAISLPARLHRDRA